MNIRNLFKALFCINVGIMPISAIHAEITTNIKDIDVTFYGQVNRAVQRVNDGRSVNVLHVDNDDSSTRVGFQATGNALDCFKVGGKLEYELEVNASNRVTQLSISDSSIAIRHADVWLSHEKWGKVSMGRGNTASGGTAENMLSGTKLITYSSAAEKIAGGMYFHQKGSTNDVTTNDPQVKGVFSSMDGFSQDSRIAYETPRWSGFVLAASHINNDKWDGAVKYSDTLADTYKVKGAVAYGKEKGRNTIDGSVGVLHVDSGFNGAVAGGRQKMDPNHWQATYAGRDKNDKFYFLQLGKQFNWSKLGTTSFAVDYLRGHNMTQDDDKGKSYGIGLVQKIDNLSTELYVGARTWKYSRPATDYDSMNAMMAGMRVKF
jgi:hypothetical protein